MRAASAVFALLVLSGLALSVAANHAQTQGDRTVAFDHRTGNEWWVEATLSGADAASVAKVEAADTGGPWVVLQKKSWGAYAASFHVEAGNMVRFRASWADGDVVTSCWFTHPGGVEQACSSSSTSSTSSTSTTTQPPPGTWAVRSVGDGASQPAGHHMASGDGDGDGRDELYLATPQALWQFAWTSAGWTRSAVSAWHGATAVAAGDITGDGRDELFAAYPAGYEGRHHVVLYAWDGESWEERSLHTTDPDTGVTSMLIDDVEDDGRSDLYFGTTVPRSLVMQVEFESVDGFTTYNTRYVIPIDNGVQSLAAGDSDNDGDSELHIGAADGVVHRLDITESQGEMGPLARLPAAAYGLSVGDGDGDGHRELYAAVPGDGGRLVRIAMTAPNTWGTTELPSGGLWAPMDVAVADADNAGGPELLVAGNDGGLYRYAHASGAWTFTGLAQASLGGVIGLLVDDVDNDGLREAYLAGPASACCSTPPTNPVVQISNHAVAPRPAPAWHESRIGDVGGRSGEADIAVGDGDRDGQRDVYVAARHGLFQFKWTGASWQRTQLSAQALERVAVGDGDRDGRPEVYASGFGLNGGHEVLRFVFDNGAWRSNQVHASTVPVGTLTIGDVDDDGASELYIAMMTLGDDTASVPSYQLEFEGGSWQVRSLANLVGGARSSWIGDADRDGDREWYLVGAAVHRIEVANGAGTATRIGGDTPTEEFWFNGIASVDADRDGQQELFVGYSRQDASSEMGLHRYAPRSDGWERTSIVFPAFAGPRDVAFGDVDGDGRSELYASGFDGGLWQVRWTGTAWSVKGMADVGSEMGIDLALGDADGDGLAEAYMTAYDTSRAPPHNVYRLAPTPPVTRFDATFSAVRGNEWWIQATVAASGGTLAKVEVRLNGDVWQPLTKQSWGGWAASYRAVEGTVVQMRATGSDGATDLSPCYRWVPPSGADAATTACPGGGSGSSTSSTSSSTTGSPFDATFTGVKGNAWWVQASVTANAPVSAVDARIGCTGEWKPLAKQSYGWAASFHVPDGSKVDFRARSTSGATDLSGGYIWPSATSTSAC